MLQTICKVKVTKTHFFLNIQTSSHDRKHIKSVCFKRFYKNESQIYVNTYLLDPFGPLVN